MPLYCFHKGVAIQKPNNSDLDFQLDLWEEFFFFAQVLIISIYSLNYIIIKYISFINTKLFKLYYIYIYLINYYWRRSSCYICLPMGTNPHEVLSL